MADTTPGDRRGNTENLKKAVAKRARWGTPGDWGRCHAFLKDKVSDDMARRICSQWHRDETGVYPGDSKNVGK